MTPEEAYEEALRRIREAERTGAVELDLSGLKDGKNSGLETLNRLPHELGRLTSLKSLDLSGCWQLGGDMSPLASPHCPSNRSAYPGAEQFSNPSRWRASNRPGNAFGNLFFGI